jgi:hypothetical protein
MCGLQWRGRGQPTPAASTCVSLIHTSYGGFSLYSRFDFDRRCPTCGGIDQRGELDRCVGPLEGDGQRIYCVRALEHDDEAAQ